MRSLREVIYTHRGQIDYYREWCYILVRSDIRNELDHYEGILCKLCRELELESGQYYTRCELDDLVVSLLDRKLSYTSTHVTHTTTCDIPKEIYARKSVTLINAVAVRKCISELEKYTHEKWYCDLIYAFKINNYLLSIERGDEQYHANGKCRSIKTRVNNTEGIWHLCPKCIMINHTSTKYDNRVTRRLYDMYSHYLQWSPRSLSDKLTLRLDGELLDIYEKWIGKEVYFLADATGGTSGRPAVGSFILDNQYTDCIIHLADESV